MSNSILKVSNLSHSYEMNGLSIKNLNLEIDAGERVSIQGPSGCGKSTLLRLIAGLEEPSEGQIFINGDEVSSKTYSLPPEKRHIGLVVQDKALFPHLSVYENICFGIRKESHQDQIAYDLMNLMKINELKDKFPHQISGGEKQRVALARSLAPDPNFLMMDEPFSALDSELKHSIYNDFLEIFSSRKTTLLLVTHDSVEASIMTQRQLIMEKGEFK